MALLAGEEISGRGPRGHWALLLAPLMAYAWMRGLWAPDEPRYAQVAQELVERGRFLVLYRCGELYPDKPPLLFWLAAVLGALSDWSPAVMRTVSLLSMAGVAALTGRFARRYWGEAEARWAPALLLTMVMVSEIGGRLQIDPLLALCCVAALYSLDGTAPDARAAGRRAVLAGACAGLAALAKGPVAFVNIGLPWLAWRWLARGETRPRAPRTAVALGLALSILPVLVWALAASWVEPALVRPLFYGQHLERAAKGTAHTGPPWQNLLRMPAQLLPWTPIVLVGLHLAWRDRRARTDNGLARAGVWLGALFLFFSIIPAKRDLYLLPAYPAAALVAARAMTQRWFAGARWLSVVHGAVLVIAGAGFLLGPLLLARFGFDVEPLGRRPACIGGLYLLAALWAARAVWQRKPIAAARACLWGWAANATVAVVLILPIVDPLKSPRAFALRVAARPEKPSRIPCLGVWPEGYRFYGRIPAVIVRPGTGEATLTAALDKEGARFLAIVNVDSYPRLSEAARARCSILDRAGVGGARVLLLGAKAVGHARENRR